MKACLIREIGNERFIKVMHELKNHEDGLGTPICDALDPGIITIARQLFVLDYDRG
jgi:hypothetical protein